LFVCVKNSGKSQMAAGLMRLVRNDIAGRVVDLFARIRRA
jgi:protein-tyrosine-phosphatase